VNHQPLADDTHGANLQINPLTNTFVNPNPATIKQAGTSVEALNSPGVINAR
jgi:hypothetical protein